MRRVKMLLLAAVCVRTILSQTIAKVMLTVELEDGRVEKTLVPGDVIEHRVREWCMELRAAEMPDCISGITTQLLEAHAIKAATPGQGWDASSRHDQSVSDIDRSTPDEDWSKDPTASGPVRPRQLTDLTRPRVLVFSSSAAAEACSIWARSPNHLSSQFHNTYIALSGNGSSYFF